jgi:phosphoenolpyruvate synthase/pyruvate phosphate dikinase
MRLLFSHSISDSQASVEEIGGKAANLLRMERAGFPVPAFAVLPASAVDDLIRPVRASLEGECQRLEQSEQYMSAVCEQIQRRINQCSFPENDTVRWVRDLEDQFGAATFFAVRSSAVAEDGSRYSFAGQHDTHLFVRGGAMVEKIRHAIASAWKASALAYRRGHGLSIRNIRMAIVIQPMVLAQRSGVSFSMNWQGNMAEMVIVAGYGVGEGIVADKVDSDTYQVLFSERRIRRSVSVKKETLVFHEGSGLDIQALNPEQQAAPVLGDSEIMDVCHWTKEAEKLLNSPADVEFSYDAAGQLFVLQMRPITTIDKRNIKILDNTNIVESYPGVTLPLTFDFVVKAYEKVFVNSAGAFGVAQTTIAKHRFLFRKLIAHHQGRIYYRLDHWYRMMALVMGSPHAMDAWERSVGLADTERHKVDFSFRNRLKTARALVRMLVCYPWWNRTFFRSFKASYPSMVLSEASEITPKALWEHYERITAALFKHWHYTLVNDFIAFKAFGWLQLMLRKWRISDRVDFANDLLIGTKGMESEMAVISLLELKEKISAVPKLYQLFVNAPLAAMEWWQSHSAHPISIAIRLHLDCYGDRTLAELKLENPSLKECPDLFFQVLQKMVKAPGTVGSFREKQEELQQKARRKLYTKLRWWNPRRYLLLAILAVARYGLKNRENMRFCRTRAYSAVKQIFSCLGQAMADQQVLANARDVFYLQMEQLKTFSLEGDVADLKPYIEQQRRAYEAYKKQHLPSRIIYQGSAPPITEAFRPVIPTQKEAVLRGTPVSSGIVEAETLVIEHPELDMDATGKILVTHMTDPGWVFLMTQAAGLIAEKGSLLSHTALVGRELGIPTIVGIPHAKALLPSGTIVQMDGSKGIVKPNGSNNEENSF